MHVIFRHGQEHIASLDIAAVPRMDETVQVAGDAFMVWKVTWDVNAGHAMVELRTFAEVTEFYNRCGLRDWTIRD